MPLLFKCGFRATARTNMAYCFAQPVIGPARGRTRWLAMTLLDIQPSVRGLRLLAARLDLADSGRAAFAVGLLAAFDRQRVIGHVFGDHRA